MPDPTPHPREHKIRRVALHAMIAGLIIMAIKFGIFALTNSVAVLSDAMESIINIAAAGMMLYSIWLSNKPADPDHPYGHGKVEFMAVGLEGWMILIAGVVIAVTAINRLIFPMELPRLDMGLWLLGGTSVLTGALAVYVLSAGKKYDSAVLRSDGKHLLTDVFSTVGVLLGLLLVRWTGKSWVDPLVALVMASIICFTSWKLLWHSIDGLMDRSDPEDDKAIRAILDEEVRDGHINGYHKVRHRHQGPFHWVDMHLQVNPDLSVQESHDLASKIEYRIETLLGQGNATAHVEPSTGHSPQQHAADHAADADVDAAANSPSSAGEMPQADASDDDASGDDQPRT